MNIAKTTSEILDYTIDTYGMFDPNEYSIDEGYTEDEWDKFNHKKYVEILANKCADILSTAFTDDAIVKSVVCVGSTSPREYNFSTDQADLDVEFDLDALVAFLTENKNEFSTYVKERHSSYDGFISFINNEYDVFLGVLKKELKHIDADKWDTYAGSALSFYMHKIFDKDLYHENMYECLNEDIEQAFL